MSGNKKTRVRRAYVPHKRSRKTGHGSFPDGYARRVLLTGNSVRPGSSFKGAIVPNESIFPERWKPEKMAVFNVNYA